MQRFNLKKLNNVEGKNNSTWLKSQTAFQFWKTTDDDDDDDDDGGGGGGGGDVGISRTWGSINY
jgi:hypothetical protein